MKNADMILNFSIWGRWVGLILICLPLLFDVVWMGVRGFMEYNMGTWGVLCQLSGMAISATALLIDRLINTTSK